MRRRQILALSSGLLATAIAGCVGGGDTAQDDGTGASDEPEDNTGSTDESDDSDGTGDSRDTDDDHLETLVSETNGFAFDLYSELLEAEPDENLFASPISISIALAMTYAGAREETREQMRDVLRYQLDDDLVHQGLEELQREFDERGGATDGESDNDDTSPDDGDTDEEEEQEFQLSVVNSVWGQEEYPFEQTYLDTLESHYGGGLREVDFESDAEGAREQINDWVADETEDRIDELLPQGSLDELTRLVLVNAVYFLANWKHTFPEGSTRDETFTALDGEEHDVPMMQKEHGWSYADVDGVEAVDLPYVGDEVSMLVILPPEGEFEQYESQFDEETLQELADELESREGTVNLPRFEFEDGFRLSEPLKALGMTDAFDPEEANFDGIADVEENLFIHEAFHDTFVAVDEEGTEAAAATGVVVGTDSAPADPFEFVADRPFLFAIRDRPTGSLLFFGRVVDPAGWE